MWNFPDELYLCPTDFICWSHWLALPFQQQIRLERLHFGNELGRSKVRNESTAPKAAAEILLNRPVDSVTGWECIAEVQTEHLGMSDLDISRR